MRIAIVSDIHGNLLALDAVMTDLESQAPDEVWCGGDIGWGGPWASECIERCPRCGLDDRERQHRHLDRRRPSDDRGRVERKRFQEVAGQHDIGKEAADWLINLPLGHTGAGIDRSWSTARRPHPSRLPSPPTPPASSSPTRARELVVYGHVHIAFSRRLADGTLVCNPGSVGMPKDGPTASYLITDLAGAEITLQHRRIDFDRRAGLAQAATAWRAISSKIFTENVPID